ncbi:MAG: hypothetical protein BroJett003_17100 [Planctomycetota bacterium]|nr:MAG: hypothetical protein BroJett003_17100 [Planctomycetota bacterium]
MIRKASALAVVLMFAVRAGAQVGPDVITGSLSELERWGTVNGYTAFSVGTISCNIGDQNLEWIADSNRHPVIAQNLYRLKDGQFEQIGMSWLKHGFCALQQTLCSNDCNGGFGCLDYLSVNCSDPYSAGLNGNQFGLGPRSEVNPVTGSFAWPYGDYPIVNDLSFRLQVNNRDLNPSRNEGALYFIEGHYVHRQDASRDNDNNNASYRRVRVVGSEPNYNLFFVDGTTTQRMRPAILAWEDFDSTVKSATIDVPSDGRFIVAYKVTDNGDGTYNYEYAVYNMNSHRSGQSFTIPVAPGAIVTNVGYHDIDHHSGEGENGGAYKGTDWAVTVGDGFIMWTTDDYDTDVNANALRWGTLFNFRFTANVAPGLSTAILGLFRPGTPDAVDVDVLGPGGDTTVPCGAIKKFVARCNPTSGKVIGKVVTNNDAYDGLPVEIGIDGNVRSVALVNRRAKYSRIAGPGNHTVELVTPAACKDPIEVNCD